MTQHFDGKLPEQLQNSNEDSNDDDDDEEDENTTDTDDGSAVSKNLGDEILKFCKHNF